MRDWLALPWPSVSMTRTRRPRFARHRARFTVTLVLPTPPLKLMTLITMGRGESSESRPFWMSSSTMRLLRAPLFLAAASIARTVDSSSV